MYPLEYPLGVNLLVFAVFSIYFRGLFFVRRPYFKLKQSIHRNYTHTHFHGMVFYDPFFVWVLTWNCYFLLMFCVKWGGTLDEDKLVRHEHEGSGT